MKILVAVKRVIDYNVQIRVKEDGSGVVTDNVKMSTNPPDDNAIEEAVKIKEAGKASEIIAVTVGEEKAQETVRKALAVGADKNSVETVEHEHFTKKMIDNFFRLSRSTYAEGLGALYAYERQVPEIAETKIKGLVDHYEVSSDEGLEYFVLHKDADVEHREQSAELMNKLSDEEKILAKEAGLSTVKVLWGFLSGLCEKHNIQA